MQGSSEISMDDLKTFLDRFAQEYKKKIFGASKPLSYKGYEFLPGATSIENLRYLEEWKIPENSVFVSTFPKTGTTWCTEVVRNILCANNEQVLERSKLLPLPLLLLEMTPRSKFDVFDQLPLPRKYFATHVAEEFFNFQNMKRSKSKMIYVIRNPKDQVVSYYHFSKRITLAEETQKMIGENWSDFLTSFVNGEHVVGLKKGEWYPDHILGWLKHRGDDDFLIVEYEAMKKDFHSEIRRIGKFLEVDLTKEEVKKVVKNCSIGTMQKKAESDNTGFLKMNVRKGEVGGWKDQFTVAQSELMDKLIEEKMGESGIQFTYTL